MGRSASGPHRPALERLGLPETRIAPLERYLDLLARWDARVNLTGLRGPGARVARLVGDVVPLGSRLEAGLLLDVGSGNGSPGLVLALLRPEIPVTLLEPRTRRWAFLREAARAVGRPDIQVLRVRHDAYAGPPARSLTLRALALPLPELLPLLEEGGRVYVLGRPPKCAPPFVAEGRAGGAHVFRRVRST